MTHFDETSPEEDAEPERSPFELALVEALRAGDDDVVAGTLLAGRLFVPCAEPPKDAEAGGAELDIPVLAREEGRYAVAFSSQREQRACDPEWAGSFVVPAPAFFAALDPELGFALNPLGSFGLALRAEEVERLRQTVVSAQRRPPDSGEPG